MMAIMRKLIFLALIEIFSCAPSSIWYRDIGDNKIDETETYKLPLSDYLSRMRNLINFKETHRYLEKEENEIGSIEPRTAIVDSPVNPALDIEEGEILEKSEDSKNSTESDVNESSTISQITETSLNSKVQTDITTELGVGTTNTQTTGTIIESKVTITSETTELGVGTTTTELDENTTNSDEVAFSSTAYSTPAADGTTLVSEITMTIQTDLTTELGDGTTTSNSDPYTSADEVTVSTTSYESTSNSEEPSTRESPTTTDINESTSHEKSTTMDQSPSTLHSDASTESSESGTATTDDFTNESATVTTESVMSTTTVPKDNNIIVVAELLEEIINGDIADTPRSLENVNFEKLDDGRVKVTIITNKERF